MALFVLPAKHGQRMGIMTPSALSVSIVNLEKVAQRCCIPGVKLKGKDSPFVVYYIIEGTRLNPLYTRDS